MVEFAESEPISRKWASDIAAEDIWVLGRSGIRVGRCITWQDEILPNFADCKYLIVDMTTLGQGRVQKIPQYMRMELPRRILKRFRHGLRIVCILPEIQDNVHELRRMLFWCPKKFSIELTDPATTRKYFRFVLEDYVKNLKEWTMVLKPDRSMNALGIVRTNNDDLIAGEFEIEDHESVRSGRLVILPHLDDAASSINVLLKSFVKSSGSRPIPDWAKNLKPPGLDRIISQIKSEKEAFKKRHGELLEERDALQRWNLLLFSSGEELEGIVGDALAELGLENVRPGSGNVEDLVFDLEMGRYGAAVVEVKGKEHNMKRVDLRQAMEWAIRGDPKPAKPVVVSNTFRLDEYPESRGKRMDFAEFEEACKRIGICIIPTIVLYDLVCQKIGGAVINTELLRDLIASSSGAIRGWESVASFVDQ